MVLASDLAVFPVMFARAFGGDFLTKTFELIPDPAAMEKGLTILKTMFDAGALPRSYATTKNDDQVTWIQQGRAAFTVLPFARHAQLNNPEQSKFPGKIKAIEFPVSAALKGKTPMATVVESWGMVIPSNSRDKDLSWRFIREVSSKRVTLGMAINGNGPVRVSTYKDESFAGKEPASRCRGCCAGERTRRIPAVPRSGAGAIHLPRGGAACGARPQAGQRGRGKHLVPNQATAPDLTDRRRASGEDLARRPIPRVTAIMNVGNRCVPI